MYLNTSTMYTDIEMNINLNMKVKLNEIDFSNPIPIYKEIEFERESKFIPFELEGAKRTNLCKNLKCEKIEVIPHAHGTHLESKSHLSHEKENEAIPFSLNGPLLTKIVNIKTIDELEYENERVRFVIIKKESPRQREFEGLNDELIEKVFNNFPKIEVIGINEPSFDPEFDSGKLLAHRKAFFRTRAKSIYLVESLNLDHVCDGDMGTYYCLLNLYRFGSSSDAYPCSPVLYPISRSIGDKMILNESGCLFCKIIRGTIPAFKVYENNLTLAFLDINPLSEGHIVKRILHYFASKLIIMFSYAYSYAYSFSFSLPLVGYPKISR